MSEGQGAEPSAPGPGLGGAAAQLVALRRAVAEAEAEAIAGAQLGTLAEELGALETRLRRLRKRREEIEGEEAALRSQVGALRAERARRVGQLLGLGAPLPQVAEAARLSPTRVRALGEGTGERGGVDPAQANRE